MDAPNDDDHMPPPGAYVVQTNCEYCGASHIRLCTPECQRPKLFFRKKRPPFCPHPERWDPHTEYAIDVRVIAMNANTPTPRDSDQVGDVDDYNTTNNEGPMQETSTTMHKHETQSDHDRDELVDNTTKTTLVIPQTSLVDYDEEEDLRLPSLPTQNEKNNFENQNENVALNHVEDGKERLHENHLENQNEQVTLNHLEDEKEKVDVHQFEDEKTQVDINHFEDENHLEDQNEEVTLNHFENGKKKVDENHLEDQNEEVTLNHFENGKEKVDVHQFEDDKEEVDFNNFEGEKNKMDIRHVKDEKKKVDDNHFEDESFEVDLNYFEDEKKEVDISDPEEEKRAVDSHRFEDEKKKLDVNNFEDEKKEVDVVEVLQYSPPQSNKKNTTGSSVSNDHGTWWMTNLCTGSPSSHATTPATTVTPPAGASTVAQVVTF